METVELQSEFDGVPLDELTPDHCTGGIEITWGRRGTLGTSDAAKIEAAARERVIEAAKLLFLRGEALATIAERTGAPERSIRDWSFRKGWRHHASREREREAREKEAAAVTAASICAATSAIEIAVRDNVEANRGGAAILPTNAGDQKALERRNNAAEATRRAIEVLAEHRTTLYELDTYSGTVKQLLDKWLLPHLYPQKPGDPPPRNLSLDEIEQLTKITAKLYDIADKHQVMQRRAYGIVDGNEVPTTQRAATDAELVDRIRTMFTALLPPGMEKLVEQTITLPPQSYSDWDQADTEP